MAQVNCDWFDEPLLCLTIRETNGAIALHACVGEDKAQVVAREPRLEVRDGVARVSAGDVEAVIDMTTSHPHAVVRRGDCEVRATIDCGEPVPYAENKGCNLHVEFYVRDVDDED